ncbi:hypothetical protein RHMOL_Rhmol05G0029800 [Rhododendron molle]|uniref:Uncharacterized protein n=1 Tax=Rhododendron molle TaxID=49168 RepID=A0ACC0NM26_RHOML|nr:hypothetical protein RHMOL_Rhmol05G0029800 [Rhododendron molle]
MGTAIPWFHAGSDVTVWNTNSGKFSSPQKAFPYSPLRTGPGFGGSNLTQKFCISIIWLSILGRIANKNFLFKRHVSVDNLCPRCPNQTETAVHALRDCVSERVPNTPKIGFLHGMISMAFLGDVPTLVGMHLFPVPKTEGENKQIRIPWVESEIAQGR